PLELVSSETELSPNTEGDAGRAPLVTSRVRVPVRDHGADRVDGLDQGVPRSAQRLLKREFSPGLRIHSNVPVCSSRSPGPTSALAESPCDALSCRSPPGR